MNSCCKKPSPPCEIQNTPFPIEFWAVRWERLILHSHPPEEHEDSANPYCSLFCQTQHEQYAGEMMG